MTKLTRLMAGTALATCIAGGASASMLMSVDPADLISDEKLFTSEWKRDRDLQNGGLGGQRGNDIFLRNGEGFGGPNFNVS